MKVAKDNRPLYVRICDRCAKELELSSMVKRSKPGEILCPDCKRDRRQEVRHQQSRQGSLFGDAA